MIEFDSLRKAPKLINYEAPRRERPRKAERPQFNHLAQYGELHVEDHRQRAKKKAVPALIGFGNHTSDVLIFKGLRLIDSQSTFEGAERAARALASLIVAQEGVSQSGHVIASLHRLRRTAAFYDLVAAFGYSELGEAEENVEALLGQLANEADPRLQDVAREALEQLAFRRL